MTGDADWDKRASELGGISFTLANAIVFNYNPKQLVKNEFLNEIEKVVLCTAA